MLVARVDGYPGEQLRTLAADLQRRGRRVVVLVGALEDKVSIAVASDETVDATERGQATRWAGRRRWRRLGASRARRRA